MKLFRIFRITVLIFIFIGLAFYSKNQKLRVQTWAEPLPVVLYPINAEHNPLVDTYIQTLSSDTFADIDAFFQREGQRYGVVTPQPFATQLGATLTAQPPAIPEGGAGKLAVVWWGLKLRYWAYKHTPDSASNAHRVRVFLYYHEARNNKTLQHSTGLDKGLLAIVHAFAAEAQAAQNNIVIAHELLHTAGASDKYGVDNLPLVPDGLAEPDKEPLYPQTAAEIMAGRILVSGRTARMPQSLEECVVGKKTAQEIHWVE